MTCHCRVTSAGLGVYVRTGLLFFPRVMAGAGHASSRRAAQQPATIPEPARGEQSAAGHTDPSGATSADPGGQDFQFLPARALPRRAPASPAPNWKSSRPARLGLLATF